MRTAGGKKNHRNWPSISFLFLPPKVSFSLTGRNEKGHIRILSFKVDGILDDRVYEIQVYGIM